MEGEDASLGRAVTGNRGDGREAGHAGNGDNVTMVSFNHVRQELLGHLEMRHQVDGHDPLQCLVALVQHQLAASEPGIVDHHGRRPDFGSHLLRHRADGCAGADVELVEMHIRRRRFWYFRW